jgi:hypothetical protein
MVGTPFRDLMGAILPAIFGHVNTFDMACFSFALSVAGLHMTDFTYMYQYNVLKCFHEVYSFRTFISHFAIESAK